MSKIIISAWAMRTRFRTGTSLGMGPIVPTVTRAFPWTGRTIGRKLRGTSPETLTAVERPPFRPVV